MAKPALISYHREEHYPYLEKSLIAPCLMNLSGMLLVPIISMGRPMDPTSVLMVQ